MKHSSFNPIRKAALLALISTLALAFAQTVHAQDIAEQQAVSINLPAGPLRTSLVELGEQLGVDIFASSDLVGGKTAPAVSGELTADEALERVLAGTGLEAEQSEPATFVIAQTVAETDQAAGGRDSGPDNFDTFEVDRMVVTGTRIERSAANAPSPIDIVTAEEIGRLGINETTEALRFVPSLQQSNSITGTADFRGNQTTSIGLATLDLRGLGTERTLVLVNGKRHISGSVGTQAVDVSTIPAALIERVEVLTGGGSSIYGADAVSGVVNYILRDDFQGIQANVNYSLPTQGGGNSFLGALTIGGNFADDRGNAVLSVEYNSQSELIASERAGTRLGSNPTLRPSTPALAEALGIDPRFRNAFIPDARRINNAQFPGVGVTLGSGTFFDQVAGGNTTIGGVPNLQFFDRSTGDLRPFIIGAPAGSLFFTTGGDGASPLINENLSTVPEFERYVLNAIADYDISDSINAYVEAKYSRNTAIATPRNDVGSFRNLPISRENPFLPTQIAQQFDSLVAQGLDPSIGITGSLTEEIAGPRVENDRETFRIIVGLRGELSPSFNYDVSVNYGRTQTQLTNRAELLDRFFAGVDAIADPDTGQPVCRSDLDPNAELPVGESPRPNRPGCNSFSPGDGSCVPINPFGLITQEAADFYLTSFTEQFELEQVVVNATVTGTSEDLFTLSAGPVGYAAGLEYREERSSFSPDAAEEAGLGRSIGGRGGPVRGGSFDVFEGFAEVNIPVLADLPFVRKLDLDASIRVADYSTVGTTTTFAVGAVWRPIDDLRIRGSFNRAIRAPNINELFNPQVIGLSGVAVINDPCLAENIAGGTEFRAANCAQLVPSNFSIAELGQDLGVVSPALLTTGGNPNLQEETAETFTMGFVFQPTALPGLTVIADYYNIKIEDAIQANPRFQLLSANCVDAPSLNNAACGAVGRNQTTGIIEVVQATALNLAESRSQGIDYQLSYEFATERVFGPISGDVVVAINGTYLIEREEQAFAAIASSIDDLRGEAGGLGTPAFPEHFFNASIAWSNGAWNLDYGFNYQSSQVFSASFFGVGIETVDEPFLVNRARTGDAFVHYLGGAYEINDNFILSLRVNNLFDRDPFPLIINGGRVRPTSLIGRTVQFGLQAKF